MRRDNKLERTGEGANTEWKSNCMGDNMYRENVTHNQIEKDMGVQARGEPCKRMEHVKTKNAKRPNRQHESRQIPMDG